MTQPAGWYPQPDGTQRYWDGRQWTSHVAPAAGPTAPQGDQAAGTPKKAWYKRKRVIIPAVAITAIVALSTTQGRGEAETASPGVASVPAVQSPAPVASGEAAQDAAAEPAKEAAEEPTEEPAEDPAEEAAEPEEPSMTASQEQAVRKAEQYIDFAAFSRSGLIKQLKYEGFSGGDAKFAVDHIDVDWMEQAALKAEDYLEFTAFSRSGLMKQLQYEGFTRKQAEHGAKAAGL